MAAWGDHGVDLAGLDVVELLASLADLWLGGGLGNNEDEGVVILSDFHGGLRSSWVLDDSVLVVGELLLVGVVLDLVVNLGLKGLWTLEGNGSPLAGLLDGVSTLLNLSSSVLSLHICLNILQTL